MIYTSILTLKPKNGSMAGLQERGTTYWKGFFL
uniref:Putative LOC100903547 [Metaseiulus occidentalis] n=1 Tax=Lepeophtheirus salmonis TaxID=72036 RepID=A0A0K2T714_LEPSM